MISQIILALTLLALSFGKETYPCYRHCRFHFCDDRTGFHVKSAVADKPFSGAICDIEGYHVGTVTETGEAWVKTEVKRDYSYFELISEWSPRGLKHRFSKTFFKALSVKGQYYYEGDKKMYYSDADKRKSFMLDNGELSGEYYYLEKFGAGYFMKDFYTAIARESFQENQGRFIRRQCIVLPFRKWQILDDYGAVKFNAKSSKKDDFKECVAFYTG